MSKTTLPMGLQFYKINSGAIWKEQINYNDKASGLPGLIVKENIKRNPFVLGREFLVFGLLIFVGSIGTIFYNISNAQNWLQVIHSCTALYIWSIISSSPNLHCFKTPLCGRGADIIILILFIGKLWPREGGASELTQASSGNPPADLSLADSQG